MLLHYGFTVSSCNKTSKPIEGLNKRNVSSIHYIKKITECAQKTSRDLFHNISTILSTNNKELQQWIIAQNITSK